MKVTLPHVITKFEPQDKVAGALMDMLCLLELALKKKLDQYNIADKAIITQLLADRAVTQDKTDNLIKHLSLPALKMQTGSATSAEVGANALAIIDIGLSSAWPNVHTNFLLSLNPNSADDIVWWCAYPLSLSAGRLKIKNGATAQTFGLWWLSLGY